MPALRPPRPHNLPSPNTTVHMSSVSLAVIAEQHGKTAASRGVHLYRGFQAEDEHSRVAHCEEPPGFGSSFLLILAISSASRVMGPPWGPACSWLCLSRHSSLRRLRSHRLPAAVSGGPCSRYRAQTGC